MVCYTHILYLFRAPRRCSLRLWLWVSAPPFQPPWGASCATAAAAEGGRFCRGNGGKTRETCGKTWDHRGKTAAELVKLVKENGGTSVFSQHFRRTLPVCGAFPAIPKSRPFSLGFLAVVPAGHMKIGIWGMEKTSTSKSFL